MKFYKGQKVIMGGSIGTVIRGRGPHAIEVSTYFEKSVQDFATCKISTITGYRRENWPVKGVTPYTTTTKSSHERCEDAPCCGCCT